jgi:hypothetical protein
VAAKVEGDRIWIRANGAGDQPVGWVSKVDAILLENAVPYFTSRIESSPKDWDAYLRRAESEHSLNQRDAAIADYTRAIELHPDEPFLLLRRGREFRIVAMKAPAKLVLRLWQIFRKRPVSIPNGPRHIARQRVYMWTAPIPPAAIQRKQLLLSNVPWPSPRIPRT